MSVLQGIGTALRELMILRFNSGLRQRYFALILFLNFLELFRLFR